MLNLYIYPDPILKQKCERIEVINKEVFDLAEAMEQGLYDFDALGLAAPQIGHPICMIAVMLGGEPTALINPKIVELEGRAASTREGCVSIPGVAANLNCRNDFITVEAETKHGSPITRKLMAVEAVIVQHEVDHLDGVTLFDRMGTAQRELKKNSYLKKHRRWKRRSK
jgi:peptide deformylase